MRLRLTPRDGSFVDLLTQAAVQLVTGAEQLGRLVDAPAGERPVLAARMRDAEHHSDDLTHALLRQLNSTFVTPFDREDIYALASALDDCMDHMESATDLVVLYRVETLPEPTRRQARIVLQQARCTAEAIPKLSDMADLDGFWIEINRLENEGDGVYRSFLAELFGEQTDAVALLKLKEVTDALEAACDAFEKVSHRVQTIAIKES